MSKRDNRGLKKRLHTIQLPLPTVNGKFEIPLTQGKVAIVSPIDADLISLKWHAVRSTHIYYAASKGIVSNQRVYMHRYIARRMGLVITDRSLTIDHINGDPLDNRRENLRIATHAQNMRNRRMHKNNKSGFKGVYSDGSRWRAEIAVGGNSIALGSFRTPEAASRAYKKASLKYHGEFARIE